MFIIIAYDVDATRTEHFKRICQKYLIRVQNSVFEGELSNAQFLKLKHTLKKEIHENEKLRIWITSKIIETIKYGNIESLESGFI